MLTAATLLTTSAATGAAQHLSPSRSDGITPERISAGGCPSPSFGNSARAKTLHGDYLYAITSGHSPHLVTHRVFKHSKASTGDGQAWLRGAERDGHELRCLCTGAPSSPLLKQGRGETGRQHPRKANGTVHEHAPDCVHGDVARLSEMYGAPHGSIAERDGVISINFDLLFPEDVEPSDGTGEWQGGQRDHGAALRSIMWLLLVQAGLNCSWLGPVRADPWDDLLRTAKSIRVNRKGLSLTLADVFLTQPTQKWHGKRNYAKLINAVRTTKRVLVACELQPFGRDSANRNIVDLGTMLDVKLDVGRALLARALGQSPFAAQRHAAGHSVLAFGFAKARKRPTDRSATGQMNQLVLMPVGVGIQPLPTQAHADTFADPLRSRFPFKVTPEDDPIIAMRRRVNRLATGA